MRAKWTPEQLDFMRANYPAMTMAELAIAVSARFGIDRTLAQIKSATRNHRITSGRNGRFEKGLRPWNTGTKGTGVCKANKGCFSKGNVPPNRVRLWTERVTRDDYIEIKIPERNPYTGFPTRFRLKHTWLWEGVHGKLPKGHIIVFADGDRRNFDANNLMLVSRHELLLLNLHKYWEQPPEMRPALLTLVKLEAKAGIRTVHAMAGKQWSEARRARHNVGAQRAAPEPAPVPPPHAGQGAESGNHADPRHGPGPAGGREDETATPMEIAY